jgi:hypothetical protein
MADKDPSARSRTILYLALAAAVVFLVFVYFFVTPRGRAGRLRIRCLAASGPARRAGRAEWHGGCELRAEIATLESEAERLRGEQAELATAIERRRRSATDIRRAARRRGRTLDARQAEIGRLEGEVAPMREEIAGFEDAQGGAHGPDRRADRRVVRHGRAARGRPRAGSEPARDDRDAHRGCGAAVRGGGAGGGTAAGGVSRQSPRHGTRLLRYRRTSRA